MWLQSHFNVIPGAVYHIDRIDVQISLIDFFDDLCSHIDRLYFSFLLSSQKRQ